MDDRAQAASDPFPIPVVLITGFIGLNVASGVLTPAQMALVGDTLMWVGGGFVASAIGGLAVQYTVQSDIAPGALEGP